MKDETIFEDPKSNKAWASADAIRKKHGCPHYVKPGLDTVIHTRLGTPLPPSILAKVQISSGLLVKWDIRGQKCCFVIMAAI
jgi:dUTPase